MKDWKCSSKQELHTATWPPLRLDELRRAGRAWDSHALSAIHGRTMSLNCCAKLAGTCCHMLDTCHITNFIFIPTSWHMFSVTKQGVTALRYSDCTLTAHSGCCHDQHNCRTLPAADWLRQHLAPGSAQSLYNHGCGTHTTHATHALVTVLQDSCFKP